MSRKRRLCLRLFSIIPVLWIIVTVAFFLMRAVPGGPFDKDGALPAEVMTNLNRLYQLDQPLWKQYLSYLGRIVQGDLGPSFKYPDRSVSSIIIEAAPTSLLLGTLSFIYALILGLLLGLLGGIQATSLMVAGPWRWLAKAIERGAEALSMLGLAMPSIILGPLLVSIFAMQLAWLPVAGWYGWTSWVLPTITLGTLYAAAIARLSRAQIIETSGQDHVRVAHAKGLGPLVVHLRHVLRSALTPVISFAGPAYASLLSGSIVVEQLFQVPGLGQYFLKSAINRDYTLALGTLLFYAALLVILNALVDLLYTYLDPRVGHET